MIYTIFSRKKEGIEKIRERGYNIGYLLSYEEYKIFNSDIVCSNKMNTNITETNDYNQIIKNIDDYKKYTENNNGLYRYTNLNNPNIHFNNNIVRLVQNYRSSFLQLGLEKLYSNENDKNVKTLELLEKMDTYFPPEIIPVNDPQLDIQIGRIYSQAGKNHKLKERLDRIKNNENLDLQTNFYLAQVYINELNDYTIGLEIYSNIIVKEELIEGLF